LLVGVGIVTIGRNPNGVGRFYSEVSDLWQRRRQRRLTVIEPVTASAPVPVGSEVRSVG